MPQYNKYSILPKEQKSKLVEKLLETISIEKKNNPVIFIGKPDSIVSKLAISSESEIFYKELGDNHTPEVLYEEFEPYDENSVFFISVDNQKKEVMGVGRGIIGEIGSKETTKVFDQVNSNTECKRSYYDRFGKQLNNEEISDYHNLENGKVIAEFATIAVTPEGRKSSDKAFSVYEDLVLTMAHYFHSVEAEYFVAQSHQTLKRGLEFWGVKINLICDLPPYICFEGDNYEDYAYFLELKEIFTDVKAGKIIKKVHKMIQRALDPEFINNTVIFQT